MQRPTGPTGDGCHSVNYDIHTRQVTEWNVGCERCHGPGSEHIAHRSRLNILNPSQMDYVAANYAQLRKPADKLCLDCHGQTSPNGPRTATLAQHTHHKEGSPGSRCIACHMPKIETQGVPGAFVSSHTFKFITPEMTDKYKIPNACTSCHTDKSTDWATKELMTWKTTSPWRVGE